jgi:hypothetical protein
MHKSRTERAALCQSSEYSETSPKKGRGPARRFLDLIQAMRAVAKAAQPITGRGVGYKLFTRGLAGASAISLPTSKVGSAISMPPMPCAASNCTKSPSCARKSTGTPRREV